MFQGPRVKDTLRHHDQCCVWWRGGGLWCVGAGVPVQGGVVERCEISGLCDEDSIFFRQTWQTLETGNKDSLFLFPPLCFFFTLISVRTTHIIRPKAWLWGIFSYQCRLKRSPLYFPQKQFLPSHPSLFSVSLSSRIYFP